MKKILLLLAFGWACSAIGWAQIPNGSIAPNFTVTDINGQSHNLYNLLDQGKTVYLDVFATWCVPCWNYHQTHALKEIWDTYGPPGTNEAYVIAIEGDGTTSVPCITNAPGCVGGTVGDWSDGTPYPIADAAFVASLYQIAYYPTIFMICPADRKVYEAGQQPAAGLWAMRNTICPPLTVSTTVNNIQSVSCFNGNNGAIDISVSGGSGPYTYNWSNGLHTQDLTNVPAGTYTCTVTNAAGWTGISDPITVDGPSEPLNVMVSEMTPVGCNGITGSISVEAFGGWPADYSYHWNTGQNTATISGLAAGNYTVTVTDDLNCTKTLTVNMPPAALPATTIATPSTITCLAPSIQLTATVAGGSGDFTYQWFASNGGNIVSGGTTPNPVVNAAGNYAIQVTDVNTTCVSFMSTAVSGNTTQPTANAGPGMTVTCAQPSTALAGSGTSGSNITYLWTASNGGNIVSGAGTLTPTVNTAGTYTLVVTNTSNGCTQASSTTVTGFNTPPTANVTGGALTCVTNAVTISSVTNAGTPSFAWTGPNGFTSTAQNPTVNETGDYTLTVLDAATGCTNTATAVVSSNTTAPGAAATGGTLTCVVNSLALNGTSGTTGVTFSWTGPNGFTSSEQNPTVSTTGDYNLVVTNTGNGCTSTAVTAVVQNIVAPAASALTPGNLNCQTTELQLDGTASAQGANMTYAWTTTNGNIVSGGATLTPIVNAAGTYALLVTNQDNGCTSNASTAVIQNPVVTASINNPTNVGCNGGANGEAVVVPGGGNATYTYNWSNGATGASATGLTAGTYTVVVTDGENCSATTSVNITQPAVLVTNATATAQTAAGVNDGTATANPVGGTSGYTFAWSNGGTTQTITDLAPGNYTVVITDANGCTADQTVTVNTFNCTIAGTLGTTNVTCFGANNGTATVSLLGANDPVIFAWSNGSTSQSVENLAPGAYTVEVTDVTNCVLEINLSISEPTPLIAHASAQPESGAGSADGTATASPTGGSGDYTYNWSNGETTQTITGLAPNVYTVTVTDVNGCTNVESVTVVAFNCIISTEVSVSNVSCAGLNNGTIALTLTGGTEPFAFAWSNGETTQSISGLAPGTYTGTATDANGCEVLTEATVTEPTLLTTSTDVLHPVCANDQTGAIDVTTAGGTTPYTFAWSNGATTSNLSGLAPGAYTLSLTDANGCAVTNTYILTATDLEAPAIAAQNTTLALGTSGSVAVTLQTLGAAVTDNCAVANVTIEPSTFDCSTLGTHEVIISATDDAGNESTTAITVEIVDDIAPVLTCPANLIRCSYESLVTYDAPVAVDNCIESGAGEWSLVKGLPSGSEFPVGETTQIFSYTDASGNVGTCTFSITVTPPIDLAVTNVTNDQDNKGVGAIDITVSGGSMPYTYTWTRNGEVVGTTEDLNGIPAGKYNVEVKDANGCIVAETGILVDNTTVVIEPTWLIGVSMRPNPTNGLTQISFASTPASQLQISLIDATGRVVLSQISDHQPVAQINCSALPEGVYLVRFSTGTETGVRKLIVSR